MVSRLIQGRNPVVRGFLRAGGACLTIALLLAVAHDRASGSRTAIITAAAPDSSPNGSCQSANLPFRLGNAARPLAWSTAIADFNVDGAPDIAVADRVAHGLTGYSYRIQLSISGQQSDAVTFESVNEAIQLHVSDVDADNDLDLVASGVLTKDIVGVWLNDGHGRFTSSDVRHLPGSIGARQVLDSTDPAADPASFDSSPRRSGARVAVPVRSPPAAVLAARCASRNDRRLRSIFRLSATGPRAPPSPS
jgi:hypothetical protein